MSGKKPTSHKAIKFDMKPELNRITTSLNDLPWSGATILQTDITKTLNCYLESELSALVKKYYLKHSDLKIIHQYLNNLKKDKLEPFNLNLSGKEYSEKSFAEAVELTKRQIDNIFVSEKRKRILPITVPIIISTVSLLLSILTFVFSQILK